MPTSIARLMVINGHKLSNRCTYDFFGGVINPMHSASSSDSGQSSSPSHTSSKDIHLFDLHAVQRKNKFYHMIFYYSYFSFVAFYSCDTARVHNVTYFIYSRLTLINVRSVAVTGTVRELLVRLVQTIPTSVA